MTQWPEKQAISPWYLNIIIKMSPQSTCCFIYVIVFLFCDVTEFPEITDCFRSYTTQDNIFKYSKHRWNCRIPDAEGTRSIVLSHFYSASSTGEKCWSPQTAHSIYTRVTISLALAWYGNFYVLVCVYIRHQRINLFLFNDKALLSSR